MPFSLGLGLIHAQTLLFNVVMTPIIILGVFGGRWLTHQLPQRLFDTFLLAFAAIAALRLIGLISLSEGLRPSDPDTLSRAPLRRRAPSRGAALARDQMASAHRISSCSALHGTKTDIA